MILHNPIQYYIKAYFLIVSKQKIIEETFNVTASHVYIHVCVVALRIFPKSVFIPEI